MKKVGIPWLVAVCVGSLAASCQSSDGGDNSPGGGGSLGVAGQGGSASGNAGSAGQQNGASGEGGNANSGGNPSGGTSSGGDGGGGGESEGGASQIDGGASEPGGGAAGEGGTAGQPGNLDGGMSGGSLEDCFAGLREGQGRYQDATKESMDGMYRFRMALETADRFGTSGSVPWLPYRFAIETPMGSVCVTDEEALAAAYLGSLHNCEDVFIWEEGQLSYRINHPDTAVDRPSMLSIYQAETQLAGPIRLDLAQCHVSTGPGDECGSGGPCGI